MKLDLRTSLPATLFALALTFGLGCGSDGAPALDGGAGRGGRGGAAGGTAGAGGGTGGGAGTTAAGGRGGSTGGTGGAAGAAGASGGRGGAAGGTGGAAGASGGRGGATGGTGGAAGAAGGTGGAAGAAGGTGGAAGAAGAAGGTGGAAGAAGGTGGAAGATGGAGGGAAGTTGGTGGGGAAGTSGPDGGLDGSTGDAGDGPICQNECTLAATRCGTSGGVQTCIAGSSGCTVWGAATACPGVQICAGGACTCPAAPAGCGAAGTNCLNGALVTCTPDAQGCLAAASAACPTRTTCTGSAGTAACTCVHECQPVGNFCYGADAVGTCGNDANNCRHVTGTTPCVGVSTCSAGACVCPGPVAVPVAGGACPMAALGTTACAGTDILTCVSQTGSNCPIWEVSTPCGPSGLTCNTQGGGTPACQCPVNAGTTVYVDPDAGSDLPDGTHPHPTGIQTPAQCRFATLTKGLMTVGSPGTVTAISAAPVTFALENFPITVPAGVTLRTNDSAPTPANYRINFADGAVTSAIVLGAGSTFQGFSVVADAAAANGATNLASCSSGTVTLNGADLDGSDTVPFGFNAEGTCSATLNAVGVRENAMAGVNVGTSGTVNILTGEVVNSLVGVRQTDGTVNIGAATMIQLNTVAGILLTGSNLPNLVISSSTVQRNGIGINVTRGSLSATNTQVLENVTGAGIILASGPSIMHTLSSVNATANVAGAGVVITNGIVTATGLTADVNGANGVTVGAGSTVTLNNAELSGNVANAGSGLVVNGGAVTVSGGLFDNNGGSGIVGAAGTLTISGNPSLGTNNRGLALLGSTATVASANVHHNTTDGIFVDSADGVLLTIGTAGGSPAVVLNANARDGIRIDRSPVTSSAANSVVLENVSITANGGAGVNLTGTAGAVASTIRNCAINTNGGIGIAVAGAATTVAIQNNVVATNNTGGAAADNIGGIRFGTPVALTSFIGNRVHSNGGDEVGFAATAVGSYTLGTGACNDGANFFYCYGGGNVGLRVIGVTAVDASSTHWTSAAPAAAVDYSLGVGSSADVTAACSAAPACP